MRALVAQEYPHFLQTYDQLQPVVAKADFFRLLAVHHFGGFYFDLDVRHVQSLEPLLDRQCIFPYENNVEPWLAATFGALEAVGQYAFAARRHDPFLMACLENIDAAVKNPEILNFPTPEDAAGFSPWGPSEKDRRVLYTTGPGMIIKTLAEREDLRAGVDVLSAVNPKTGHKINSCFGPFAQHICDGNWRPGQSPLVGRLVFLSLMRRLQRQMPQLTHRLGPFQAIARA
jgi:hypothetical protein